MSAPSEKREFLKLVIWALVANFEEKFLRCPCLSLRMNSLENVRVQQPTGRSGNLVTFRSFLSIAVLKTLSYLHLLQACQAAIFVGKLRLEERN